MVFSLLFCQRSAILEAYRRMIMKKAAAKSNTFDSDAFQMLFDGRIKDPGIPYSECIPEKTESSSEFTIPPLKKSLSLPTGEVSC